MSFASPVIHDNVKNGERVGHGTDKNLFVQFHNHPVKNNNRSKAEGRPCYDNKVYVRIISPGDKTSEVDRLAHEGDFERFPNQYKAFLNKNEGVVDGTPLEHWPALDAAMLKECKEASLFTVEQIAALPDTAVQKLGMGFRSLKNQAQAFIEFAKDTSLPQKLAADLQRERDEKEQLKATVAELAAQVKEMREEKRGPGRPRKDSE
jgi:hypothetical protein